MSLLRMRGLSCFLALALVFALLAVPSKSPSAQVFNPTTFTLDNGLEVVVIPNHRAPIVTHMLWYKVGAADEPPGKSGIAHFLEHLMFKGTETLGPGEFSAIIARNGGQENAFTSYDYTAYYQTVAKDRLAIMMQHEADRMTGLVLSDEVVLPERDVILEERRSRVDNSPGSQLSEMVRAALYLNHPYRIPVIGWEHEMRGLTTEDAIDFYRRWYAPNNAVLIVAGDVTADDVRPLAEATYGKIEPREVPVRQRLLEPPQLAARRVELESERVRQPSLSISFLAPSASTGDGTEATALEVFNEAIGSGATTRLYRSLVVEQGLAVAAGSAYSPNSLDYASIIFYASPRPGVELEAVEAALRAEIDQIRREGITREEVDKAKQRLVASARYARDELSTGARVLGVALTTGSTVEAIEAWPRRIEAVTQEQVNQVVQQVLDDGRSVTGVLRSKPTS